MRARARARVCVCVCVCALNTYIIELSWQPLHVDMKRGSRWFNKVHTTETCLFLHVCVCVCVCVCAPPCTPHCMWT